MKKLQEFIKKEAPDVIANIKEFNALHWADIKPNRTQMERDFRQKCQEWEKARMNKMKHLQALFDERDNEIEVEHERRFLRKGNQEESLEQQREWGQRFSAGVAKQL